MIAWLSDSTKIAWVTNIVTIVGFPIAIFGLAAVARQMRNDRLAVSASSIGQMRLSLMDRIERIELAKLEDNVPGWSNEFSEFLNDLEMACAIYLDGQMSGRTGSLAKNLICDLLDMINNDPDLAQELAAAVHATDTFTNIRDFRSRVKRYD